MNPPKPQKLIREAKFSGPRGDLNPLGLKVPGLISVQVYPVRADKWIIKNPDTNGMLSPLTFASPDIAMRHCLELFSEQETDWDILNMNGTPHIVPEEPEAAKSADLTR